MQQHRVTRRSRARAVITIQLYYTVHKESRIFVPETLKISHSILKFKCMHAFYKTKKINTLAHDTKMSNFSISSK